MKTIKITFIFIALFISFISCEKENTAIPEPPSPVQLFTPKDQAINVTFPIELLGKSVFYQQRKNIVQSIFLKKQSRLDLHCFWKKFFDSNRREFGSRNSLLLES